MRVVVVGAGAVFAKLWAPALRAANAEVVCVVDPNKENGTTAADMFRCRWVASTEQLGADPADVGLILAPPGLRSQAIDALSQAGSDIVVEKPLRFGVDERAALDRAVHRVRVGVALPRSTFGATREAADLVASGSLGVVQRVVHSEGAPYHWPVFSTDTLLSAAGSIIMDTGSHAIQTIAFVLREQILYLDASPLSDGVATSTEALLRGTTTHGVDLAVALSRRSALPARLDVIGTHGAIRLSPYEPRMLLHAHGSGPLSAVAISHGPLSYPDAFASFARDVASGRWRFLTSARDAAVVNDLLEDAAG